MYFVDTDLKLYSIFFKILNRQYICLVINPLNKMTIKNTKLAKEAIASYHLDLGSIYFYENLLISEINQGKHVNLNTGEAHMELIYKHFKEKPFVYISNRVNEFSINTIEFEKFCNLFPNMKAFTTVYYSSYTYKNLIFEKKFCTIPYFDFKDIMEAFKFIKKQFIKKIA